MAMEANFFACAGARLQFPSRRRFPKTPRFNGVFLAVLLFGLPNLGEAQFYCLTNQGTLTVTGYGGPAGDVVIPSMIDGYPVVSVADYAFRRYSVLTNVTISSGITNIGYRAFFSSSSLVSVIIPESVQGIGDNAFAYSPRLTSIRVHTNNLIFSSTDGILFDKSQKTLIQYPAGKAGSYVVPNSVARIADDAFAWCGVLTGITVPASVTNIGTFAFQNCDTLTFADLRASGPIGPYAFASCTRLGTVTLGAGINLVPTHAFQGCVKLTAINVDSANPFYSSVDGVIFSAEKSILCQCPEGKTGTLALPGTVRDIGFSAFMNCTNLTGVALPNSLTNIGVLAFSGCQNLSSLEIPASVMSIQLGAFEDCRSLTQFRVPDAVATIDQEVFEFCSALTNLTLGSATRSIGDLAFAYCNNLAVLQVPAGVTEVGNNAFLNCTSLTAIYFAGDSPAMGGESVFSGDTNAKVYYLPGTVGWEAAYGGLPTAFWVLPNPIILGLSVGLQNDAFAFTVSWATNASVVVENCTNPSAGTWSPVTTNSLVQGTTRFVYPQPASFPARFFRARSL